MGYIHISFSLLWDCGRFSDISFIYASDTVTLEGTREKFSSKKPIKLLTKQ